jgi:peptide/nickel transport system substrate-binding protein
LGTGETRQAAPNPDCSYFKKEWADFCAEYSPDKANALLDEMGLDQRDADGYRLRPDGETLSILIELTTATDSPTLEVTQVVAEHWNEVGVKATYKEIERDLLSTRARANEIDVGVWHTDRTNEARGFVIGVSKILPETISIAMPVANEWVRWKQTNGEQGEEPPEEWKQHFEDIDAWHTCATDEQYMELAQKVFDFCILEQLLVIGTVGFTTWPVIAKKSVGNFPPEGWAGDDTGFGRSLFMETWYRKEV